MKMEKYKSELLNDPPKTKKKSRHIFYASFYGYNSN